MTDTEWTLSRDEGSGTWRLYGPGSARWFTDDHIAALTAILGPKWATEDLPEGVERRSDGTTWMRVEGWFDGLPDGWTWVNEVAWERASEDDELPEPIMVEVRPVPQPKTERVQWWEARGRKLPNGRTIGSVGHGAVRAFVTTTTLTSYHSGSPDEVPADADGQVEVLCEDQP